METPTAMTDQYTMGRLVRRAWTILVKEPWGKGRVSRGESLMAGMVLGVMTSLLSIPLSWIHLLLPLLVSVVGQVWAFGYLIRRAQDLGKSKKYVVIPLGGLLILTTLIGFMGASLSPATLMSGGRMWLIGGLLFLVFGVRSFIVVIKLLFVKGTSGDNTYGTDPLLHQPAGNGLYRGVGILLFIAILILSPLQKQPPQPNYADFMGDVEGQLPADIQAQMQDAIDQAAAEQEGGE